MKKIIALLLGFFVIGFFGLSESFAQEKITLSTYYPAPYGEYRTLAVGDTYTAPNPTSATDLIVEGNVGIGTISPGAKLDVAGSIRFSLTGSEKLIAANGGTTFLQYDNVGNVYLRAYDGGGTTRDIHLQTGTPATTRLFIDEAGKIGINTTTPNAKLTLSNNVATGALDSYPEYQMILWDAVGAPINSYGLGIRSGTMVFNSGRDYDFDQAGTTVMAIKNGRVGIGTTAPAERLHILGNIQMDDPGPGSALIMQPNNPSLRQMRMQYYDGKLRIGFWTTPTGAADWKMVIQASDGNVGIGTINPQGTLDVNGPIYQRGTTVLHADYVFEPSFKLESIEEHAEFMFTEKRLKAVPKAIKEKEGYVVELGAQNNGVMEELEKAHIYIAQLNDKIKQLESKVSVLENKK